MFLKAKKWIQTGVVGKRRFCLGAVVAVSVTAAGLTSPVHARGVTVVHNGKTTTVDVSRPGSNTGTFSGTIARVFFPVFFGFPAQNCVNAGTVYPDAITATMDILSLLLGDRFCPDSYDMDKIDDRCNGVYQDVHPRNEQREGMEGDTVRFVRTVNYGKEGGGFDEIRDLEPGWIYYGWGDCWNRRYFGSSVKDIQCNNSTFGDPKPGVRKQCFYERNGQTEKFQMKHFHWT